MKLKKFDDYLKKRLDPQEITEIESQADIEFESLKALQNDVSQEVIEYMKEEKIGFNELVRRLDFSPTQVAKIQKGEANLTFFTLAHLAALFNKHPHIVFTSYIDIVENIEISGVVIQVKYKKEESATIDREEIKRIAKEGIEQYVSKREIDIFNIESVKSKVRAEHPFYSIEIFGVKMKSGETYFDKEIYHHAA